MNPLAIKPIQASDGSTIVGLSLFATVYLRTNSDLTTLKSFSIARLFYSDRDILIFDEATNALDEKNEKSIFDHIKKLKGKKTILIISHNLENLKICDKLFKLENKKLKII